MKTTMSKLRSTIRKIMVESLGLEDDPEFKRHFGKKVQKHDNHRRAYGIQTSEEIKLEKDHLRDYQAKLDSQLKANFVNGNYTICHGLDYETFTDGPRESNLVAWLRKYGTKGKDALSCTAYSVPVENLSKNMMYGTNHQSVFSGAGLLLKGYPVFISADQDLMSQTLSAIPEKLKQHQKNSGVAKRTNPRYKGVTTDKEFRSLKSVNEVLLDNWTVVGVYMTYDKYESFPVGDEFHDIIEKLFGGIHIVDDQDYQEYIEY